MKKITFFVYDLFQMGGIEKVVTLLANELVHTYQVEIVSLYQKSETPFFPLDDRITVKPILGKQLDPIKLYYPYLRHQVKKALKHYQTDVFVCAGMGYVGLTLFMRKKATYIAWEHATSNCGKIGGIMWLGRVLAAHYADKVVVLTKRDKERNQERFHTGEKLVQIYNPIEEIEQKHDYDITSKAIVSAGRLTYQKGFDYAIAVAEKVLEKYPDWEWHIYGEGEERENLQKGIDEKNLQNKVILKGQVDSMKEVYPHYAMFVLTSRYEGFCMVLLEAQNAKLPEVSFTIDFGPDEIIQDGVNGYLVKPFAIQDMANQINDLIEHPEKRKRMSEQTLLDREKLQMKTIVQQWKQLIES